MAARPAPAKKPEVATMTSKANTPIEPRRCIYCASEIGALAKLCPICKNDQEEKTPCIKPGCGTPLVVGTKVCHVCKKWQDGKFHLSSLPWEKLVTGVSVSGLVGAGCFLYAQLAPSKTSFKIQNPDQYAIHVLVSNDHPKKTSLLVDYRLDFGQFPLENARLELLPEDQSKSAIAPGDVSLGLAPQGLTAKTNPRTSEPYTKEEILSLLKPQNPSHNTPVALWIVVRESNGKRRELAQSMEAASIRELIERYLPGRGN
jgi:hypothetical protein